MVESVAIKEVFGDCGVYDQGRRWKEGSFINGIDVEPEK